MLPEIKSQNGRGKDVQSETPARVEGVCTQSESLGNTWTSRFHHCGAPRHFHTQFAWSSECVASHAELPAVKKEITTFMLQVGNETK